MTSSVRGAACRLFVAALLLGAAARPASAGWVTFDFNYLTTTTNGDNASVQTYMNGVLGSNAPGMTVSVVGATSTNTYTGDGHVVGPVVSNVVKPLTLGTTEGADPTAQMPLPGGKLDSFLTTLSSTEIDMTFSGGKIYGISFDYEIFPNASCPSSTNCPGGAPDFTFKANNTTIMTALGVAPSTLPYTHSTFSGPSATEQALQLGPKSFSYTFANGVNYLQFIDWPVVIGIDNLKINTTAPVPEPTTLLLLGSGLAGAYARRRRQQRNGSAPAA